MKTFFDDVVLLPQKLVLIVHRYNSRSRK